MSTDYNEIRAAVDDFLRDAGVAVAVDYVTPDKRDNYDDWGQDRWLEWRVTLSAGKSRAVFGYRAGEGHCPAYKLPVAVAGNRNSIMRDEMIQAEIDSGKTFQPGKDFNKATGPAILPDLAGVLHCLVSDADAYNMRFEDWAGDYGYDPDSRRAEKVYRACVDCAEKLHRIFSAAQLDTLRDIVAEY